MDKLGHKISLIIPAHNEAENISRVLKVVSQMPEFDEIIVVADACSDQTATVAKKFPVKVVERTASQGKGSAMFFGTAKSQGDILMFCDADLETLTAEHIRQILAPVVSGQATMSVGLRDRAFGLRAIIPKIFPMYAISGQRAMTREFFESLPQEGHALDFGIETVMNYHAKRQGLPVASPVLKNLRQVIKEKKWGWGQGFFARLGLMYQVWRSRFIMKYLVKYKKN